MTNPPNSDHTPNPEPSPSPPPRRRWRRLLIPSGVVLAGAAGAAWWGYGVLKAQLPAIVERELSKTLERPVKIGRVERLTFGGVRVGASSIPATATDKDTLTFAGAEISYNIPAILWTRDLKLNITIDRPNLYLDQAKDGEWVSVKLPEDKEDDPNKGRSDFDTIRFRNGAVTLVPWGKYGNKPAQPIILQQADGSVQFSQRGRRINFDTTARSLTGGQLNLTGESQRLPRAEVPEKLSPNTINLQVQAQNFLVSEFDRLVKLPFDVQSGRANANVGVKFDPRSKLPSLSGTAQFSGVALQIPKAPAVIQQAKGTLQLRDKLLRLENTQALFGKVPLTANGDVDLEKGFNLTAVVASTKLPDVVTALKLKTPIALIGSVAANIKITGSIKQPVLSGDVRNVSALRFDKTDVDRVTAKFRLDLAQQNLTVSAVQATPRGGGQVTGNGSVKLSGQPQLAFDFRLRDVSADAVARNYATDTKLPPIGRVSAIGKVTGPSDRALVSLAQIVLLPPDGGSVTGTGSVRLGDRLPQLAFNLTANNVPGNAVARTYASVKDAPLDVGLVNAKAALSGTSENLLINLASFAAQPRQGGSIVGSGTVRVKNAEPQLALTLRADNLPADSIARAYVSPQTLPFGIGRVTGRADLTGTLNNLLVELPNLAIRPTDGGLVTGSGTVRLRDRQPQLALNFEADNVPADRIARAYISREVLPFGIGKVTGRANLAGNLNDLLVQIPTVVVRPSIGGVVTGAGSVRLVGKAPQLNLNLQARGVSGAAIARAYNRGKPSPVELGTINAKAEIAGSLTAPRVVASAVVPVQGGVVNTDIRAAAGRWQATFNSTNVRLAGISPELRGVLNGDLTASGRVASFRPRDIRAQGQVRLSEGVSLINRPLTADLRWDGQKVVIDRAVGPGFGAAGFLFANLEGAGAPALTGFDLNVRTRDLSLQALKLPLPVQVPYSGEVDFNGRVRGTPTTPKVAGAVALKNFVLNQNKFESPLLGTIRVDNGVNLDLNGQRDRIALTLSPTYQPIAFEIRSDEIYAKGTGRGNQLTIEARNFPLAVANLPGTLPLPVSGVLTTPGLTINLKTFETNGQVAIVNPAIGTFQAQQFAGFVNFTNGIATLKDAQLRRGETTIQLTATANIRAKDPEFNGKVSVARGRVQDVLELLQVFDLSDFGRNTLQPDYGNQADLQTTPVALGNATVLEQLQRLAEVRKLIEQAEARRQQAAIPGLEELQGYFNAEITASGSRRRGVTANFDVQGQDWQWRNYTANRVIARGSFEKGVLTLLPVRIQANDAVIAFSGQVLGTEQSGQFRMVNVPINALKEFAVASVGGQVAQSLDALAVDGKLNATATISGRFDNPQVLGEITLAEGVLNGTSVQSAQGSFQYGDARLDFGSNILIAGDEPIRISGSLPYRLPFASVTPKSSEIALDVDIRNEGLTLLNLLNNQIAWVDGQGEVQLKVRGDVLRPNAQGFARIEGATIAARSLPEPLTNVKGLLRFDNDRITIAEKIEGQFSKGQVAAEGTLPLIAPFIEGDRDFGETVTVSLDNLNLNLKGLYRGAVNGRVEVLGTALTPQLTGVIRVSDGEVLLAQSTQGNSSGGTGTGDPTSAASPVEFKDLRIELGDRLRVTSAPILNFVAVGDLTVNGTLNELRPAGKIRLTAGQVNLFTTQFTLDRAYPQLAEFVPSQGLDPNLNVRLIASVPETTGGGIPASGLSSEIAESAIPATSFGGLQTVRIRAEVNGAASQIFDNLVLSSSPSRSESEIVSLIGGGFITTLGRGDSLLGIANLAGSALLTNFQTVIGNALGLSEFRLFPTLIRDGSKESRGSSSTLGLAAEAAIDITPTISLSALKILTTDDPAQFGVRYRLNDRTLVRGSTDFSGDNRLVIEYEARF